MIAPTQITEVFEAMKTVKPIPTILPPRPHFQVAHDSGFRTLWVTFAILAISAVAFVVLSWSVPVQRRLYHTLITLVTVIGALSYFAIASGQGWALHCDRPLRTPHVNLTESAFDSFSWDRPNVDFPHHQLTCRQVFWARYVDWAISTPLVILQLALLAGVSGASTFTAVVANVILILAGLFSAFGRSNTAQKWGWYVIAIVAFLTVVWHVGLHGTRTVRARSLSVVRLFSLAGIFVFLVWAGYAITWAVAAVAQKASVDAEIFAYAVLDILAKPVFGLLLLWGQRSVPETRLELDGWWAHGASTEGRLRVGDDEDRV